MLIKFLEWKSLQLVWLLIPLVVASCQNRSPLPVGETYSNVEGTVIVRTLVEGEVDYIEDGITYGGRYTIDKSGKVRIVVRVLGMEVVQYMAMEDGALVLEAGDRLYSSDEIAEVREFYYCAVLVRDVEETLAKQKSLGASFYVSGDATGLGRPSPDIHRVLTGVAGKWFALWAQHERCSRAYLWTNRELAQGDGELGDLGEIEARFVALQKVAVAEQRAAERRRLEEQRSATLAAERVSRDTILAVLRGGRELFGYEKGRSVFEFRIKFQEFDPGTGKFFGFMDYYPEDDRSIINFEGSVHDSKMQLTHTRVVREGTSVPSFIYTFIGKPGRLEGKYEAKSGRGPRGEVIILLDENITQQKRDEVQELEARLRLVKESRTPGRVLVSETTGSASFSGKLKVELTDVSLRMTRGSRRAEEFFFDGITEVKLREDAFLCRIDIRGRLRDLGEGVRTIDFGQNSPRCEAFYELLEDALGAWKTRYPALTN